MKRHWLIVLMAVALAGCSQGGSSSGRGDCSDGVCAALRVVEPVQFNAPVVVRITVTSDQDRSDLGLTLYTDAIQATIDGPQGWESTAHEASVFKYGPSDGAGWSFDAKANVPVQFTRVLRFADKDQLTQVFVALSVPPRTFVAFAFATIRYFRDGVQVYGMGTPIAGARTRALETLPAWITLPDGTRIPYPTPYPSPTFAERPRPPTPTRPPYP